MKKWKYALFIAGLLAAMPAVGQISEWGDTITTRNAPILEEQQSEVQIVQKPRFMGKGFNKFKQWVADNVGYPRDMVEQRKEGPVTVVFVVETDGSVTIQEVLESPDIAFTRMVLRAFRLSPKWTPGRALNPQTGEEEVVRMSYQFSIHFNFPQEMDPTIMGKVRTLKNPRTYGSQD